MRVSHHWPLHRRWAPQLQPAQQLRFPGSQGSTPRSNRHHTQNAMQPCCGWLSTKIVALDYSACAVDRSSTGRIAPWGGIKIKKGTNCMTEACNSQIMSRRSRVSLAEVQNRKRLRAPQYSLHAVQRSRTVIGRQGCTLQMNPESHQLQSRGL